MKKYIALALVFLLLALFAIGYGVWTRIEYQSYESALISAVAYTRENSVPIKAELDGMKIVVNGYNAEAAMRVLTPTLRPICYSSLPDGDKISIDFGGRIYVTMVQPDSEIDSVVVEYRIGQNAFPQRYKIDDMRAFSRLADAVDESGSSEPNTVIE